MKKLWYVVSILFAVSSLLLAQAPNNLDSILIYKGETPGTGPGLGVVKMAIGETIIVTAKGVDSEGKEVLIAPTWKADKEIAMIPVEGKGRTVKVQLKEAPSVASYFSVVALRDDGKKITADVAVEVIKE